MDGDGVIQVDELREAMRFLHRQLGEEELQALLELQQPLADGGGGINIVDLMALARGPADDGSSR